MIRKIYHVLMLIIGFALFDALIGGGIAAAMQRTGSWNQTINDFYQLGFSIGMAAVLLILFFSMRWKGEALAVLALLFGYVEDTLYYVFMPFVNPAITLISHGAVYRVSGGGMFPPHISGWIGWVGRALEMGAFNLSIPALLVINAFAIVVAGGILVYHSSRSSVME